jgi:putative NADH-flavin reductase
VHSGWLQRIAAPPLQASSPVHSVARNEKGQVMRIALFGARGKTGQALVAQAIQSGHTISALVRDPAGLPPRSGLEMVVGDARDDDAVRQCLDGAEAVVSLIGSFNRKPNTDVSDTSRTIVTQMQRVGPSRLVVVTSMGVGDSQAQMRSLLFRTIIRTVAREIWADRDRQEEIVRQSGLDWTIVRPGGLTDRPATGQWHTIASNAPQPRRIMITRADLAAYLLTTIEDPALTRRTLCLFTPDRRDTQP